MYSIKETPIFLEFLKRYLDFINFSYKEVLNIENLFIEGRCNCEDYCATVYLRSQSSFKDEICGVYGYNTNKGMVNIHLEEDGFIEFEALCYDKYPYNEELKKFLKEKKINTKPSIDNKIEMKKLTVKDKDSLDTYFKDLSDEDVNLIYLGELD